MVIDDLPLSGGIFPELVARTWDKTNTKTEKKSNILKTQHVPDEKTTEITEEAEPSDA